MPFPSGYNPDVVTSGSPPFVAPAKVHGGTTLQPAGTFTPIPTTYNPNTIKTEWLVQTVVVKTMTVVPVAVSKRGSGADGQESVSTTFATVIGTPSFLHTEEVASIITETAHSSQDDGVVFNEPPNVEFRNEPANENDIAKRQSVVVVTQHVKAQTTVVYTGPPQPTATTPQGAATTPSTTLYSLPNGGFPLCHAKLGDNEWYNNLLQDQVLADITSIQQAAFAAPTAVATQGPIPGTSPGTSAAAAPQDDRCINGEQLQAVDGNKFRWSICSLDDADVPTLSPADFPTGKDGFVTQMSRLATECKQRENGGFCVQGGTFAMDVLFKGAYRPFMFTLDPGTVGAKA